MDFLEGLDVLFNRVSIEDQIFESEAQSEEA